MILFEKKFTYDHDPNPHDPVVFLKVFTRERRKRGRRKGLIGHTSMLNDDGMVACSFIGIFMTLKLLVTHPK